MGKIQKADLHMHGHMGLQPYWLKKQGYAGKNPLQSIVDECFKKGMTICAVTSHAQSIKPLSVQDRWGVMKEYEMGVLPKEYSAELIGDDIMAVQRGDNRVYLVNGQTAMPKENGMEFDMLVVGSNRVPNGMSFLDTLSYCEDRGLIKIAEHPLVEAHRGMGLSLLQEYGRKFDAIEGHNAQAALPTLLGRLPIAGRIFSRAGRNLNRAAQQTADELGTPWIATSDAHRIKDLGIAYIQWEGEIDDSSPGNFLNDLRFRLKSDNYSRVCGYENPISWLAWTAQFAIGCRRPSQDKERYLPSYAFR